MGHQVHRWEEEPMAAHSHLYSVNPKLFETDEGLSSFYRLTSIAYTPDEAKPFGNSMEAYNYPFLATQFHPEKPMTAYYEGYGINHKWES